MDYSLLLAIENDSEVRSSLNKSDAERGPTILGLMEESRYQFKARRADKNYHVSVIDFLQQWNMNKKMEHMSKKYVLNKNGNGLSAVPPRIYFNRFNSFIRDRVFPIEVTESLKSQSTV
mmetsp:Transcript_20893/g.15022  ORF Transcript_20893/g.15022 Transcript_20893/m.15022 type:complete len:119 (-) Transcript_20893:37-393(-)